MDNPHNQALETTRVHAAATDRAAACDRSGNTTVLPTPMPPPLEPSGGIAVRRALHARYRPASSWAGTVALRCAETDAVTISRDLHVAG